MEKKSSSEKPKQILFQPFPKQQEFLDMALSGQYSFVVYGGAIRGGKTMALLALFILLCRVFPGSRWAIIRKDLPTIKRNLYPSWNKIKPDNFIESEPSDSNQHTVTFKNGSKLIFFPESYDTDKELNRWRGLEVNGFGFEEINECQQASLYKAFERAGSYVIPMKQDKDGVFKAAIQPKPLVVGTCNPTQGWLKDLVYNPWKQGCLQLDWHYIQSRIYDNVPLLEAQPDYLPSLKRNLTRIAFEVFVEGDWDVTMKAGGEFYKCFEMDMNVGETVYDPNLALHVSFDENSNPYLPAGIFQINGKRVSMIAEIAGVSPRNKIRDVCMEIERLFPEHTAGMFIYGDATSQKEDTKTEKGEHFFRIAARYLAKYRPSIRVPKANPNVRMRGDFINTVLETKYAGIEIIIGSQCKNMIVDLIKIKEAPGGEKLKETEVDPVTQKSFQRYGHFTDLLDYFICQAFITDYAKYQKGVPSGKGHRIGKPTSSNNSY